MGRPLFSTLVAPAVRIAEPEGESKLPTYERWSDLNAFDPDSDEFFDGDNVVYEAFLSAEGTAEQEGEQRREGENPEENAPATSDVHVPVSSQAGVRRRVMGRLANVEVPNEDEQPELASPTLDGSSSSGSDTASSGRLTPPGSDFFTDLLTQFWNSQQGMSGSSTSDASERDDVAANSVTAAYMSRSLPTTPTRNTLIPMPRVTSLPPWGAEFHTLDDMPAPTSPMPRPARAIRPSPLTPPGSVTPRFLTWGNARGTRPRAVDMSPSPTPAGPFGSARASRMSLNYISPPALRVQP